MPAGAPQQAADIDSALLETLQHLHEMPPSVLLNIFQLMAEPMGFWRERTQRRKGFAWMDDEIECSWPDRYPQLARQISLMHMHC